MEDEERMIEKAFGCQYSQCVQEEALERLERKVKAMETAAHDSSLLLTQTLSGIRASIDAVSAKIDAGMMNVEIRNGGGINVMMKLRDIIQVLYDRPQEGIKKAESNFNRAIVIAKGVGWILAVLITLVAFGDKVYEFFHGGR